MNYKKYNFFCILFLWLYWLNNIRVIGQTQTYLQLFNQSVELYDKAEYSSCEQKLTELYNLLLKNNKISFEVLYNLGNVNFRQNKLGLARYYYELAKRINYYDTEVNYNIKLVQKLTQNVDEQNLIEQITKILSFQHLFLLIFVFNTLFFISLIVNKNSTCILWIRRISLCMFLLFGILGVLRCNYEFRKEGIIIQSTQMFSSPEESLTTKSVFLNEAKKVVILSEKENFYAIYVLQDKIQGWVKKDIVKLILN